MHAAPVAAFAAPGSTAAAFGMSEAGRRTVYYGYIATGRRERMVTALDDSAAVAALLSIDPSQKEGVALGDLVSRVIQPWGVLQGVFPAESPPPGPPPAGTNTDYSSLYILLDLDDWLDTHLSAVYKALVDGTSMSGAAGDLLDKFSTVHVGTRDAPPDQPPPPPNQWTPESPAPITLLQALQQLTKYQPLVTGGSIAAPLSTSYDLESSPFVPALPAEWLEDSTVTGSLANVALLALQEADVQPTVPSELSGMIKTDPAAPVPGYSPDTYVIRTVFEHDPCAPVLSACSRPFQLARVMDGDAPARKIRIAMPDISNLRQFKRGVAIEMPPSLRRVLDRVNPGMLQGKGLGDDPGVELGMICSFSIQIMWVLSFIVMFLFVISFNIIFWWMAFIKICFPIPVSLPAQERSSIAMTTTTDLYGTGLSFPPRVGPDGSMVWSTGEVNVRECICTILRTSPGERVEMPTFGCGLNRFLFEPNTVATLGLIQQEVIQSLAQWEPRVAINDVTAAVNATDQRAVDVTVTYTLIATGSQERLTMTVGLNA